MLNLTSIFRPKPRRRGIPEATRKRASRSFAPMFGSLETRALLTRFVPGYSLTALDPHGPPPLEVAPPPSPLDGLQGQPTTDPLGGPGPHDWHDEHVALDAVNVTVGGISTVEIALADADRNEVIVKLGLEGHEVIFGQDQGIDQPRSAKLVKLKGDVYPDLFVANTGDNNVLVFPGLADGQFGPEIYGGRGFAAGSQPVSVSVTQVGDDPDKVQVLVANEGSNDVTVTDGQDKGGTWITTPAGTIQAQKGPVMTLVHEIDGVPALFVCNSGSNTVTVYKGQGDGTFASTPSFTFQVGMDPNNVFVGHFDDHPGLDVITVNARSDDLTFIADAFGPNPTTQTISSGGTSPFAAFAIDPGQTGVSDLVVANGGDGHMALFRGGGDGLQLAEVITQPGIANPIALAPYSSVGNGFDFFAAGAGNDAALLLHFDLGIASTFLPVGSGGSAAIAQGDGELVAQLMSLDGMSLELIAVFGAGSPDSEAIDGVSSLREPSTITALYSPTEGQGEAEEAKLPEGSSGPSPPIVAPVAPSKGDSLTVDRFVSGLELALDRPLGYVEAVAARDVLEEGDDRPAGGFARLDLAQLQGDRPFDPEVEPGSGDSDGGTFRLFWSEGAAREGNPPADSPPGSDPAPELDGFEDPLEVRLETIPLASAALVASARLILKASPPRPSTFGRKPGLRPFVSQGHDPDAAPRPGRV